MVVLFPLVVHGHHHPPPEKVTLQDSHLGCDSFSIKKMTINNYFWSSQTELGVTLLKPFVQSTHYFPLKKERKSPVISSYPRGKTSQCMCAVIMSFHRPVILSVTSTPSPAINSKFRVMHFAHCIFLLMLYFSNHIKCLLFFEAFCDSEPLGTVNISPCHFP